MKTTYVPSIRIFPLMVLLAVGLSTQARAQSATEFIVNGGFETGELTRWSGPAPNPNPWSASTLLAHSGNYSAYNPALDTAIAAPTLFQTFSLTPVSGLSAAGFWYYHPSGAPGTVGLATQLLFSDGTTAQDTLFAADPGYQVNAWAYRDLRPTLSSYPGKDLVGIGFYPKGSGSQFLDDVSIVGIPEPRTTILGCLGFLSLACVLYSRQSRA